MRFNNLLRFFILFCISIVGCTNTNNTPPVVSFSTQTSIPITETPISPTQTITSISTPTIIPTLSVDDARKRLLDLLVNNGGCRLPCLWGITPGSSTYQDAQNILAPLGSISPTILTMLSSNPSSISPEYTEGDSEIDTDFIFLYGDEGIISRIAFHMQELKRVAAPDGGWIFQDIFDSKTFGERVRAYMLPQVLAEQGIPKAVLLQTNGTQVKFGGGFEILLFYPERGLFVHYETQMKIIGDKVRGCFANAHVEFELSPLGHPDTYSEMLSQTQWGGLWPPPTDNIFWKSIEKATSMSLEQFYETFRQPTDKCIETPLKLWPRL
jgi:hypothetical protein